MQAGRDPAVGLPSITPCGATSSAEPGLGHDSSTNALIRHYRTLKD